VLAAPPFRAARGRARAVGLLASTAALTLAGCSLTGAESATPTASPTVAASTSAAPTPTPTAEPTTQEPTVTSSSPESEPPATPDPTESAGQGEGGTATLVFTGEVLMHQSLIDRALKNGGGRTFDFRPMFTAIKPIIAGADLSVCHLELPVIPKGEGMEPRYATPPQVIDALKDSGFDRCSTASNHALDRGARGSDATLAAFKRTGLTQAGTSRGPGGLEPTVLDVAGFKVTHLSYTEVGGLPIPSDQPWRMATAQRERIVADVKKARALGAEYVVVSMHDADELNYTPTNNQAKWDNWLLEKADVDLVVGTGSHVPEPEAAITDGFALYGLGNLVNWRPNARDSVIGRVTLSRDGDGRVVASKPELIPTFTVESLGYQVLDARNYKGSQLDPDVRAALRESYQRVKPYVGQFVPDSTT